MVPTEPWDGQVRFPVLADVRITGCRPSFISRLLEAAPAVLTLLWERDDEEFFPQVDAESRSIPLVYPALKCLTLRGLVPFEIDALVRDIHFTALDTLALRGSDTRHWHANYIDTITRTTASLTAIHLTLSTPSKDSLDLLRTGLVRCPQLQRIELDAIFSQTGLQYFCDLFGRPLDDGSWLCPSLTVRIVKDLGHWPDVPLSGTRASVFVVLAILGTPAWKPSKSNPSGRKSMCLATVCVFLTWFFVQSNTCASGELESSKLPVTAEVSFRDSKALLAGNDLGIAQQLVTNTSSSFRGSPTARIRRCTITPRSPHLSLRRDDPLFIFDGDSGTVRGESIVRFVSKRVCVAKFDRTRSRAALPFLSDSR
ncbi:hypothetical protein EXIGLDRAFT_760919 [Exidia glandulosa HHB12029]|uniref:Uncharacterized protein n=1 Tax=Exidia glandulosa HHB12029 TaxID=1314781 RepID=A0A165NZB2_EXIGL|nr:hypothetical protein EXIGLDRAFT_760919 [Exidia glandulosa HHB12029]